MRTDLVEEDAHAALDALVLEHDGGHVVDKGGDRHAQRLRVRWGVGRDGMGWGVR